MPRFVAAVIAFAVLVIGFRPVDARALGQPPFTTRDVVITSDAGGNVGLCPLGATILMPRGGTPRGLVIFVHGSGTTNRDELAPAGFRPFKEIAERLSAEGYATLRFDKRGYQEECRATLANNPALSPFAFVRDVANVVDFAAADPELRHQPLFLLGHSEGVNFVAELALRDLPNLRGLILVAGLGRYPIDVTLLRQLEDAVASGTLTPSEQEEYEGLVARGPAYFARVRAGTASADEFFWRVHTEYWRDWIEITERAAAVASLAPVPSLVLWGDADTNVTFDDFIALRDATAGTPGSRAVELPGLHHFLAVEGQLSVHPTALEAIDSWLDAVTGR